jgi:CopG family nickel-responsive transcriptional regulator
MDLELLKRFDQLISRQGYGNRSEAIRDLIRDRLVVEDWRRGEKEVVGTITLVYDHHTRELLERLTHLQHNEHGIVLSSLHIHMDERNCLEVLVVRSKADRVRRLADRLIGTRGVKHGRLTITTAGKSLC